MSSFGSNLGFVDELYARYLEDPSAVSESWQEFFADYRPSDSDTPSHARRDDATRFTALSELSELSDSTDLSESAKRSTSLAAPAAPEFMSADAADAQQTYDTRDGYADGQAVAVATVRRANNSTAALRAVPAPADQATGITDESTAEPLRGIAGKIVANMTESLHVPTATSARTIAVKLLEENRRVINLHQDNVFGPKVSFTHLIAWAVVRALEKHAALNAGYVERQGVPHRMVRSKINLGLAIDMEKRGERVLLVPCIKDAARLDFSAFLAAYGDLVTRARQNKLTLEDFQGVTVTLTNPGMIGTGLSVPRLMQGQGAIVGAGAIGFPAEYTGMSPEVITELGLSKVMTLTSTYDHRIIQGAESGAFLATVEALIVGKNDFYERIFRELGVPQEPIHWAGDQNPAFLRSPGHHTHEVIQKQASVVQLIRAYRVHGHLWANLDPLGVTRPEPAPELELSTYGLSVWDLDRSFVANGLAGHTQAQPLRNILETLRQTYCRYVGVEYMHITDSRPRMWLQERMESTRNGAPLSKDAQLRILSKLNAAEALERFLHTTYTGHKRFSLEGAETLIAMLDALLSDAADGGVTEAIIGMAHRGRLNVLANTIGKSSGAIFREFEGAIDPSSSHGSGDVKYHLGAVGKHQSPQGAEIKLTMASNPSHLEAVNPVVEGMSRARQDLLGDTERKTVLPILIHGDAAFAGQGVVAEVLNLSELKGYRTGGTIHIVVNNQIGFTTGPADARSSLYCTDVAKMVRAPILHVNGDQPEDAVRVICLAFAFRQAFKRDVVVDLVCYRRWGHNETDDPSYTQPVLYAKIEKQRAVRKLYTEALLRRGDIDMATAEKALDDFRQQLQSVHDEVRHAKGTQPAEQPWADREAIEGEAPAVSSQTHTSRETLTLILEKLDHTPEGFEPHPKLVKQLSKRRERLDSGKVDWALAETLAFGAIVLDGTPVRLSGEDSGRGTFSQRHAILYDHRTGAPYIPLAHMQEGQAPFAVYDSLLSEYAVLGFDYGYSVAHPKALVLWEAQFGDFANGAQVIIDQFISCAEDKWGLRNSLVMLLPHGYEGQGPEHSSARMERYLQLSARGNMQVCNPSTPAQYFHLLRRQARQEPRKPLVIFTPKSLLRLPAAVSKQEDFTAGSFLPVIDDILDLPPQHVRRLVLCSGKVYYDLEAYRREHEIKDVALARLEQLYPYPGELLARLFKKYEKASEVFWVQEEPRNMGAWDFLDERLLNKMQKHQSLTYVGRPHSPSPATGSQKRHVAEQEALVKRSFSP